MNDVCLLGHDDIRVDALGRTTCRTCSLLRGPVRERKRRNVPAGRHPRETLTRVPNELLRERFLRLTERGEMSAGRIAIGAGYVTPRRSRGVGVLPDIQRLKKQLGITKSSGKRRDSDGKRVLYMADSVEYETAVKLCRAMGVDYPSEVGV